MTRLPFAFACVLVTPFSIAQVPQTNSFSVDPIASLFLAHADNVSASVDTTLISSSKLNDQQGDLLSNGLASFAKEGEGAVAVVGPVPMRSSTWHKKAERWLSLGSFNYGARYRSTFDLNGARSFDQGQERLVAGGTFKFDENGKYGVGFHLSSGRYFNWAYSDFIGGGQHTFVSNTFARMTPFEQYIFTISPEPKGFYNSGGAELYLRQLFLSRRVRAMR